MHDEPTNSNQLTGVEVGKIGLLEMLTSFLRDDIVETNSAADRMRHHADIIFGPTASNSETVVEPPSISCAKDELVQLMREQSAARASLFDQIRRFDEGL